MLESNPWTLTLNYLIILLKNKLIMTFVFFAVLLTLFLVIIHSCFGYFVLKRGVLFLDLALAQWAGLGYLVGHYIHIDHPLLLFIFAFAFTGIASLLMSWFSSICKGSNHQEAVIGILYVFASATAIAWVSSTGMDSHHLYDMFSGHLLFISNVELASAIGLYSVLLALLITFHRWLSKETFLSQLLFYALFGLLVTSSVKLAGLLLVFSLLVIPIFSSTILFEESRYKIIFSWAFGFLSSLLGFVLSYLIDIPPSFAIILCLSIFFFIIAMIKKIVSKNKKLVV